MKIAKYIFLLLILLAFALFVFISTQPNEFSFSESRTIDSNKEQVFNYVNDLNAWKNWWIPFEGNQEDIKVDSTKIEYFGNTLKKHATFQNDSIQFEVTDTNFKGNSSIVFKSLADKKTEVSWNIKGELSFKMKFLSFFRGGIQNVLKDDLQQSIENINLEFKNLFENFTITLDGFETKKGNQYIAIQDSISIDNFDEKRKVLFKKLGQFITEQNLTPSGDPFVIFKTKTKTSYKYLSCIPVTAVLDSIKIDSTAAIVKGRVEPYLAIKTTLKGNYSYRTNAWKEAKKAIEKSSYKEKTDGLYIEVYKKEFKQKPADNITEIFIPVRKPIVVNESQKDSLSTTTEKDSI